MFLQHIVILTETNYAYSIALYQFFHFIAGESSFIEIYARPNQILAGACEWREAKPNV
jgi:hypothetical protein